MAELAMFNAAKFLKADAVETQRATRSKWQVVLRTAAECLRGETERSVYFCTLRLRLYWNGVASKCASKPKNYR